MREKVRRCAHERLANASAIGRKIVDASLGIFESQRSKTFTLIYEFSCEDFALSNHFAVEPQFFVDQGEFVVFADVQHEIHVPRENTGQIHDRTVGNPGLRGRQEQ